MSLLRRVFFWDFPRGSWQYDVLVGLIVVFLFATPRDFFRDQPRATSVVMVEQSPRSFWIEPRLLSGVAPADQASKASALVNAKYKTHQTITHVEQILDEEQEVKGYMAFSKP